jgi:hypothetical protein
MIGSQADQGELLEDVDVTWPPIVAEETFWAAQRILSDPRRYTGRRGTKTLLAGLVDCAGCRGPLYPTGGRYPYYKCATNGCPKMVTVSRDLRDEYVAEHMIRWLSDSDVIAALDRQRDDSPAAAQARVDLDRARTERQHWLTALDDGRLDISPRPRPTRVCSPGSTRPNSESGPPRCRPWWTTSTGSTPRSGGTGPTSASNAEPSTRWPRSRSTVRGSGRTAAARVRAGIPNWRWGSGSSGAGGSDPSTASPTRPPPVGSEQLTPACWSS